MAKEKFTAITEINMKKGMQVTCSARGKSFILDEPKELGGTDLGMNPVEALLSALGACKCIVVKSFARMKKSIFWVFVLSAKESLIRMDSWVKT